MSGETGCGKTTQLPQFVLESELGAAGNASVTSVVCTQPRRISAVSVAARVAHERGEALGRSVGYQIRLEARRSSETKLLFCTTGVLLRRLAAEPTLASVSHVFVDEIHERGMNEDFLLVVLRDLLPRRPDLKIVLMSATLDAELFAGYFGGAPLAHIPGFTHPVREKCFGGYSRIRRGLRRDGGPRDPHRFGGSAVAAARGHPRTTETVPRESMIPSPTPPNPRSGRRCPPERSNPFARGPPIARSKIKWTSRSSGASSDTSSPRPRRRMTVTAPCWCF